MALSPVVLRLSVLDATTLEVAALGSDGAALATGRWSARSGAPLGDVCDELLAMLDAVASAVEVVAVPGLVAVAADGSLVADLLVGESPSTEPDAGWLRGRLPGGDDDWVAAVGRAPGSEWMLAKLSWLHRNDIAGWGRLALTLTPAAWMVAGLTGRPVTVEDDLARTGCWNPGGWRLDLLAVVDGERDWLAGLPTAADPAAPAVGVWRSSPVHVVNS